MRLIIMDGELILMIKYLEGYQESDGNVLPEGFENDQTLQNGILPDLLIYNYDRTPWNMMYLGDKFKFIDFGASITSRAQGGYKGFSPEIVSNGQIEAIWKNNPLYIGTPVNRAYESVLGIENDVKSLLSSMLKVFSLSVDNINEIVDEAYADVNIKDMQANIEHRLNTVLAGNEDPKYFPASVTFQAILEGGEHWTPGNEKEYLKYALITRRKAIIDHFTDMAVKDYTKKITANPVVNWTKYVQNKNEIVKDLQLSDIFKKQVVPVKPLTEDKEQTYPPENGMDVSEAYQLGVTPTDSLMDDDDIIDSVVKKAEELAEEHPEDAGELESVITDIKAAFSLNKINKFKILARIMAAIIGKIRKEDPDRYILHFARDMGLTLIIQNTLAQLESKSPGECGSALYLNRKMMGDVYFDMRNNLGTWSIQKKDLASESEKWFRNKMEAEGETAFKKLSEATYKSLTKMGVLDHQKLLLMDTAFVGTMPWYVYALIRYFDAKEGREKRDIKTLLVKSTSSMKQVGIEDVEEEDLKLFAGHGGITGMLNDNYKMIELLEGIGDMRQHPVWFDGKKV
ncbi:MAG: hypothetical protein KAI70_08460, partial [Candidatus Omnitrophica bacterium]|nr:hypothetical protein [Candidatus Omnitrophota bacterium]